MQVNRPGIQILPPLTPSVNIGVIDADPSADEAQGSAGKGVSRSRPAAEAALAPSAAPQSAVEASVQLDLEHSQRARAAVTYGPDGIFAGKSGVEVANTPAERFVANAVEVMRAYEQERTQVASGPLDRLKQAVASRFSAMA